MSKPAPMTCRRLLPYALRLFPLLWLTACATSNSDTGKSHLPDEPPGLARCTDQPVPGLPGARGTSWGNDQTSGIIGDQRTAALAKDRCAHDWRSFYQDTKKKLEAK